MSPRPKWIKRPHNPEIVEKCEALADMPRHPVHSILTLEHISAVTDCGTTVAK